MSFIGFLPKLRGKESSNVSEPPARTVNTNKRTLHFDLFTHLSYLAAIATAGVTRSQLFEMAAGLPYVSSKYFRSIDVVAQKLSIDYAEACTLEAGRTREPEVRGLLLRMGGSLSSGEDEAEFLRREAHIIGETYTNEYSREVESLRKWTDAYVALVVSAALIVIVAVISMMIYEVGVGFVVGLALGMVAISCAGAWIIYVSAPREIKTRTTGPSSQLQKLDARLFAVAVPVVAVIASVMIISGFGLGWTILGAGVLIFPVGYLARKDDGVITGKDDSVATVVRVLGMVTASTGSTVADSLSKVDRRSMGNLTGEATTLRNRLRRA